MNEEAVLSLRVFGAGRGESILLISNTLGDYPKVFIIDCYATRPYDSPEKNPIVAIQPENFSWNQVKAICMTHPHEDHFMGLEPVGKQTTRARWVCPNGLPIDSVVNYYDKFAKKKSSPDPTNYNPRRWYAESIRALAEWSKSKRPFHAISDRNLIEEEDISIKCLSPKDAISSDYGRQLLAHWGDMLNDDYQDSPHDFHNLPSAGLIVDTTAGVRVMLLGDMVRESWKPILEDRKLVELLEQKKADILKIPHHCSNGAIWNELLELICDPEKTKAVLTPFSLKRPPPHDEAIRLVSDHVNELWCTVHLPRNGAVWQCDRQDIELNMVLNNYLRNPQSSHLPPDCPASLGNGENLR